MMKKMVVMVVLCLCSVGTSRQTLIWNPVDLGGGVFSADALDPNNWNPQVDPTLNDLVVRKNGSNPGGRPCWLGTFSDRNHTLTCYSLLIESNSGAEVAIFNAYGSLTVLEDVSVLEGGPSNGRLGFWSDAKIGGNLIHSGSIDSFATVYVAGGWSGDGRLTFPSSTPFGGITVANLVSFGGIVTWVGVSSNNVIDFSNITDLATGYSLIFRSSNSPDITNDGVIDLFDFYALAACWLFPNWIN